jgi:hypothetical protein
MQKTCVYGQDDRKLLVQFVLAFFVGHQYLIVLTVRACRRFAGKVPVVRKPVILTQGRYCEIVILDVLLRVNVLDGINGVCGITLYVALTVTTLPGSLSGCQEVVTFRTAGSNPTAWVTTTFLISAAVASLRDLPPCTIAYLVPSLTA